MSTEPLEPRPADERRSPAKRLALASGLSVVVGVLSGLASAAFLVLLDRVTDLRVAHPELLLALPLVGLAMGRLLERWAEPVRGGTNLVLERLHEDGPPIPVRMAPTVLLGTLVTHLFGGSAGREGTAVQMGASLADVVAHRAGLGGALRATLRRDVLTAGVAGGFGSVFGTPLAGAVFALEFAAIGDTPRRLLTPSLVPALAAAFVGDATTRGLGVAHGAFPRVAWFALTPGVALRWLGFAAVVALVAIAFVELTELVKRRGERHLGRLPIRMAVGGLVVVALASLSGTHAYLGLGTDTIARAFVDDRLAPTSFAWKLALTSITVGSGFLGGEVTPLFFVGATLGNLLARSLGLPLELAAGVGLATVFGTAANAPLALSVMAVELLGPSVVPHVLLVSGVAYRLSGHRGLYHAQRVIRTKAGRALPRPIALGALVAPRTAPGNAEGSAATDEAKGETTG